jgi:hypothetical protein
MGGYIKVNANPAAKARIAKSRDGARQDSSPDFAICVVAFIV